MLQGDKFRRRTSSTVAYKSLIESDKSRIRPHIANKADLYLCILDVNERIKELAISCLGVDRKNNGKACIRRELCETQP